jgi:ATP-dependent Clp protease ATP-binding subunit ClpA
VAPKYQEHHKIIYTDEAIVGSVKYAQRYLSERNLPDICLDIMDEAASEYTVKKEFSVDKIPELEKTKAELEGLIKKWKGKDPEKDKEEFQKLQEAYKEFTQAVDRLDEFWGHRLETAAGGEA